MKFMRIGMTAIAATILAGCSAAPLAPTGLHKTPANPNALNPASSGDRTPAAFDPAPRSSQPSSYPVGTMKSPSTPNGGEHA